VPDWFPQLLDDARHVLADAQARRGELQPVTTRSKRLSRRRPGGSTTSSATPLVIEMR
jgi:hypothetical protein